jgi:hypothetical protein
MSIFTVEGIVEKGVVRLKAGVHLPDHTKVLVVVPGIEVEPAARIMSPRLAYPEQAADFVMEVGETPEDAGIRQTAIRLTDTCVEMNHKNILFEYTEKDLK